MPAVVSVRLSHSGNQVSLTIMPARAVPFNLHRTNKESKPATNTTSNLPMRYSNFSLNSQALKGHRGWQRLGALLTQVLDTMFWSLAAGSWPRNGSLPC